MAQPSVENVFRTYTSRFDTFMKEELKTLAEQKQEEIKERTLFVETNPTKENFWTLETINDISEHRMRYRKRTVVFRDFLEMYVFGSFKSGKSRVEIRQAILIYMQMCEEYIKSKDDKPLLEQFVARKQLVLKQLEFKTYWKTHITGWFKLKLQKCMRAYKWWLGGLNSHGTKNGFPKSKLVFG